MLEYVLNDNGTLSTQDYIYKNGKYVLHDQDATIYTIELETPLEKAMDQTTPVSATGRAWGTAPEATITDCYLNGAYPEGATQIEIVIPYKSIIANGTAKLVWTEETMYNQSGHGHLKRCNANDAPAELSLDGVTYEYRYATDVAEESMKARSVYHRMATITVDTDNVNVQNDELLRLYDPTTKEVARGTKVSKPRTGSTVRSTAAARKSRLSMATKSTTSSPRTRRMAKTTFKASSTLLAWNCKPSG